jgi:hypothetical protein
LEIRCSYWDLLFLELPMAKSKVCKQYQILGGLHECPKGSLLYIKGISRVSTIRREIISGRCQGFSEVLEFHPDENAPVS